MKPEDFDIFLDKGYYDMWCIRKKDNHSFTHTLHFMNKNQAIHACNVICHWSNSKERK